MNSPFRCLSILLISVMTNVVLAEERVIDPTVVRRLQESAIQEWQAAEREFAPLDVTYTFLNKEGAIGHIKQSPIQTFQFAYNAEQNLRLLRTQKEGVAGTNHDATNSRYSFEVTTTQNAPDGKLGRIRRNLALGRNQSNDEIDNSNIALWRVQSAFRMFQVPLSALFDQSRFRLIEAVGYEEAGQQRIRFAVKFIGDEDRFLKKDRTYAAVVDPTQRFRQVRWHIDTPDENHDEVSASYLQYDIAYHEAKDVQIPREIIYVHKIGKYLCEQVWHYELPKPFLVADSEFYLPHYGFSEDILKTLDPNPWPRRILIINGVVIVAVGFWLIRRKRAKSA